VALIQSTHETVAGNMWIEDFLPNNLLHTIFFARAPNQSALPLPVAPSIQTPVFTPTPALISTLISTIPTTTSTTDVAGQVATLQAQIQQLLAAIAQLKGSHGTAISTLTPNASASCVDLPRSLALGASGNDVMNLQNYLVQKGYLNPGFNTGYFGPFSVRAVGTMQMQMGIVSATADTAYGRVGPRTRSAIACKAADASTSPTPPAVYRLTNGIPL
jgi:hypothetical protein